MTQALPDDAATPDCLLLLDTRSAAKELTTRLAQHCRLQVCRLTTVPPGGTLARCRALLIHQSLLEDWIALDLDELKRQLPVLVVGLEAFALEALVQHRTLDGYVLEGQLENLDEQLARACSRFRRRHSIATTKGELQELFELTDELLSILDFRSGCFIRINPAWQQTLGWSEAEMLGKPALEFVHPDDRAASVAATRALWEAGRQQTPVENRYLHRDGSYRWLSWSVTVDCDHRIYGAARDVTEQHNLQAQLTNLNHRDPLTGLPNNVLLVERLETALHYARRYGEQLVLALVDIDHFKWVNDSFGYDAGDRLLGALALRLQTLLQEGDVLARRGGDEFWLLASNTHSVAALLDEPPRLSRVFSAPFDLDDQEIRLTASSGIAVGPDHGDDAGALMHAAESAMYEAKAAGRDHAVRYRPSQARREQRLHLDARLRRALEQDRLSLHYQPQLRLDDGAIIALEALLRWHDDTLGWVPPGRFIPIAEQSGLIDAIGQWVLERACQQLACWRERQFYSGPVAVNISAIQFHRRDISNTVIEALERHRLPPEALECELTESALLSDQPAVLHMITRLRHHGVRIAIDDFGTGYSSFGYLRRLPADKLKIDASFLRDVPGSRRDCAILRNIIRLAHDLSMIPLAEGIETTLQREFLQDEGCTLGQGFALARPVAADTLERNWRQAKPLLD